MKKKLVFLYADGCNNQYTVSFTTIEYTPVTPEMSSSGTYSGGVYCKKKITPAEYELVKKAVDAMRKNSSIHIKNRVMGSGLIRITRNRDTHITFYISPRAGEKEEIEILLAGLLKKVE